MEVFLASRGTMPISGLPGRPTTQGKNERSHQRLIRFLDANQPVTLEQLLERIRRYREHYNHRRPHQALNQATPKAAWDLLEHTPATEPIPMVELEAKAAQYRQARRLRQTDLARSALTISKTGRVLDINGAGNLMERAADQALIEVTQANRQVYYQGFHVSLPTIMAGRQFYRTITDNEYMLLDPETGEIVFSFPLPMLALQARGRYVASYAIRGVHMSYPSRQWQRKHAEPGAVHRATEAHAAGTHGIVTSPVPSGW